MWVKKNKLLLIAVGVTFLVYLPVFNHDFVSFDDISYYVENEIIQELNWQNTKDIFTSFHKGNYHPLTTQMWAVEHALFGENSTALHVVSLLFHLLNVSLVFLFIKRLAGNQNVAFITSFLFGIHPMHVESVAWISERKDVLYTFFFLLALIYYSKKPETQNSRFGIYHSLLFFVLACLSKSAAVVLPLILLLIDYFKERKFNFKLVIEKIPFFAISLIFGVTAIFSQQSTGAIQEMESYSFFDRIFLASYGLLTYLYKMIAPIDLVCFYPYPAKINGSLPAIFYLYLIIMLALFFAVFLSRKKTKAIIFGAMFFLISVALVLQLLPVGGALMADRYTYLSYIGLFFILGNGYEWAIGKFKKQKVIFAGIIGTYSIGMVWICFNQVSVWKSSETLWTNAIEKYPSEIAYNNRAYSYNQTEQYQKALKDIEKCLALNPNYQKAYNNAGLAYFHLGKFNLGLKALNKAIELNPKDDEAYLSRGNVYSSLNDYQNAVADYDYYLSKNQNNHEAFFWRGAAYYKLNNYERAIEDYTTAIHKNPNYFDAIFWRGAAYLDLKNNKKAIEDFTICIRLNKTDAVSYYNRSLAFYRNNNFEQAQQDAFTARAKGYQVHGQYFEILKEKLNR
ncbi:MAG: hypothetical protein COA57_01715 [Flavobacteriales bacterium]|nr:MAG: hypothetical protein COA57_01715 [Flavobacteriales bacterium]